jgi:hypothetical protein
MVPSIDHLGVSVPELASDPPGGFSQFQHEGDKLGSGPDTHTLPGRSACSLDQVPDGKLAGRAVSADRPINNSRDGSSGSWAGTPPSLRPRARTLIGTNLGAQPRRTRSSRRHGSATVSGAFEARCLTPLRLRPNGPGPASRLRGAIIPVAARIAAPAGPPSEECLAATTDSSEVRPATFPWRVSGTRSRAGEYHRRGAPNGSRGTDGEFQAWRRRPQNGPGAGAVTR